MKVTRVTEDDVIIHFAKKEADKYFEQLDEAFDSLRTATAKETGLIDFNVVASVFYGLHAVLYHEDEEYEVTIQGL